MGETLGSWLDTCTNSCCYRTSVNSTCEGDFDGKGVNENELNIPKTRINRISNSRISSIPDCKVIEVCWTHFVFPYRVDGVHPFLQFSDLALVARRWPRWKCLWKSTNTTNQDIFSPRALLLIIYQPKENDKCLYWLPLVFSTSYYTGKVKWKFWVKNSGWVARCNSKLFSGGKEVHMHGTV